MLRFWKTMNIIYERLVMIVLVLILLVVMWCMYDNYYVYSHALNDDISKYKPWQNEAAHGDQQITDDMVAWITIDGTNIDYPVMQGDDNVKYLNTDPFGKYSLSGSIFLDSRNAPDFSDDYSLIYGHHMEYGRMFGALDDFLDTSYLNSHSSGTLIVGKDAEKIYDLTVFAAMRASAKDEAVFDPDKGDIRQFIKEHCETYTADTGQRILALSTCAEGDSISRTLVFCYID
ncbi:class B sortase [Ruminococcus sp.]|uniref:class B sortase n=1 Tax=Ruminococcus sp. TaxID=41978 RepID=UPI0025E38C0C|nr:class B sortase [Ruminococcus sp.]MBQ8965503.1 class B sortase [Ruminococcus sp.]